MRLPNNKTGSISELARREEIPGYCAKCAEEWANASDHAQASAREIEQLRSRALRMERLKNHWMEKALRFAARKVFLARREDAAPPWALERIEELEKTLDVRREVEYWDSFDARCDRLLERAELLVRVSSLQKTRRRLLVKLLKTKRDVFAYDAERKDRRDEDDEEVDRLRRWSGWCRYVAKRLGESK